MEDIVFLYNFLDLLLNKKNAFISSLEKKVKFLNADYIDNPNIDFEMQVRCRFFR